MHILLQNKQRRNKPTYWNEEKSVWSWRHNDWWMFILHYSKTRSLTYLLYCFFHFLVSWRLHIILAFMHQMLVCSCSIPIQCCINRVRCTAYSFQQWWIWFDRWLERRNPVNGRDNLSSSKQHQMYYLYAMENVGVPSSSNQRSVNSKDQWIHLNLKWNHPSKNAVAKTLK